MKNRYYDRKVRESLEIDMAILRYGQDKVLNRDNGGTLLRQMRGKLCSKKNENTTLKFDVFLYLVTV